MKNKLLVKFRDQNSILPKKKCVSGKKANVAHALGNQKIKKERRRGKVSRKAREKKKKADVA